jgi:hypothetical protein
MSDPVTIYLDFDGLVNLGFEPWQARALLARSGMTGNDGRQIVTVLEAESAMANLEALGRLGDWLEGEQG